MLARSQAVCIPHIDRGTGNGAAAIVDIDLYFDESFIPTPEDMRTANVRSGADNSRRCRLIIEGYVEAVLFEKANDFFPLRSDLDSMLSFAFNPLNARAKGGSSTLAGALTAITPHAKPTTDRPNDRKEGQNP